MNKLFFIVLSVLYLLSSCSIKINVKGNIEKVKSIDTLAVIELIVSPPYTPYLPTNYSFYFNDALEKIIPDITELHEHKANEYVDYVTNIFQDSTDIVLLNGHNFYKSPEYKMLKNRVLTYPTTLDNHDFNNFAIPDGAYNFFKIKNNTFPFNFFEDRARFNVVNENLKETANLLNVPLIAVILTGNRASEPGFLTSFRPAINKTSIYFFDRGGKLVLYLIYNSDNISISGGEIEEHRKVLDQFKQSIAIIINEIYKN